MSAQANPFDRFDAVVPHADQAGSVDHWIANNHWVFWVVAFIIVLVIIDKISEYRLFHSHFGSENSAVTRNGRERLRTFGIWIFGLLSAGIFGALVGDQLSDSGAPGFFGGLFAFSCVRLWLEGHITGNIKWAAQIERVTSGPGSQHRRFAQIQFTLRAPFWRACRDHRPTLATV